MEQVVSNTYRYGLVEIVVSRPRIDDDERVRREAALRRAVACFGKEMYQKARCSNVQNG